LSSCRLQKRTLRHWFALGRNFRVIRHSLNGIMGYASIRLTTGGEGVGWGSVQVQVMCRAKVPQQTEYLLSLLASATPLKDLRPR
jgi:hypothetical protein